jgi:hypothetical protein
MKQFDQYQNELPYPAKADFETKFWYKAGKCIAKQVGSGLVEYVQGQTSADLMSATLERSTVGMMEKLAILAAVLFACVVAAGMVYISTQPELTLVKSPPLTLVLISGKPFLIVQP